MRIPEAEKIEDAYENLQPFRILTGMVYTPLGKKIKDVFIGISDPGVSYAIYSSRFGEYPVHFFTKTDLQNLFLWVVFTDNSLKPVSEVYDDAEIVDILKKGTLLNKMTIKTDFEWSNPVKIPKGLGVIIWLNEPNGGHLEVQYKDSPAGIEQSIIIKEMEYKDRINMLYYDRFKEMQNPHLRFRAKNTTSSDIEITIEFANL